MSLALDLPGAARATDDALCVHCGGRTPAGERFCCAGCAAAYDLVGRLGLDQYYALRPQRPDGERPALAGTTDPTPYVREADGACSLDLAVDGLRCAACLWLIEHALARDQRVTEARLNATTRRLRIGWRGPAALGAGFADLVAGLGYRVAPFTPQAARRLGDEEERDLLRRMAVAGFAAANIMLLSVSVWSGALGATRDLLHYVSASIAIPAMAYALRPFVVSAWAALRQGRGSMDLPVVVGVALTLGISLAETMRSGPHAYFESATMLVFFLLIGRYAERRARGRARSAAAHLLSLAGSVATIERADGTLSHVTPAELKAGDVLSVASGERLAADGIVLDAPALIDNSFVSGESRPLTLEPGALAHGGAMNVGAPLRLAVTAVGEDTLLSRIARLLEAAEQGRSRFVALADRVARLYTPVVHLLALATFLAWWLLGDEGARMALVTAVSVLIVTCPCALALAQPTVATVAIGRLARLGVLTVSPTALERLGDIDLVVFDKTGTLTCGKPVLLDDPARSDDALRQAARLAVASRHPLARALVAAAPDARPLPGTQEHPGEGLRCGALRLGSRRFCGVAEDAESDAMELWLARPNEAPVRFAFDDVLRGDAAACVAALKARGLEVMLLSGDRAPAVRRIAEAVGIERWQAGLSPDAKLARIAQLVAAGRKPLMVGDGINDAPALAAARASMSPGEAADVASAASDAIFQGEALMPVVETLDLAKGAARLMQRNVALAILYNTVAVPVAMAGLLTPPLAALAMSSSSVLVIANALRLRTTKRGA
ncbi:MAG: cadmium-translocating P-type ATPase [Alphaproteobacteria bacterium]|nr:cadmium-translocating P-type ATPase [Alphaproteobacteria bacterium]MCW5740451.1 cadmium-translocating P-type ATPase [Alphaproteobacteria bacterium]